MRHICSYTAVTESIISWTHTVRLWFGGLNLKCLKIDIAKFHIVSSVHATACLAEQTSNPRASEALGHGRELLAQTFLLSHSDNSSLLASLSFYQIQNGSTSGFTHFTVKPMWQTPTALWLFVCFGSPAY